MQDVRKKHDDALIKIEGENHQCDRLCELNVIEQVLNVGETTIVQDAWARGQNLAIHGWIYGLHDGHLRNLNICLTDKDSIIPAYQAAITSLLASA